MSTTTTAVTPHSGTAPISPEPGVPRRNKLASWLLLPASVLMLLVMGYSIVKMLILSLQEAKLRNIVQGTEHWNSFANYTKILGDPYFWTVVARTVVFTTVCVVATMVLGTLVALLLNRLGTRMRLFVLVGLLLAWATPAVTATQTWQSLFDTEFGAVNWALVQLGFEQSQFQGGMKENDWGGLMAGSVLFAMPVIIFFVIVQRRIQRGALEGGVKG